MAGLTSSELLVIVGALTAIAWVNWYFLLSGRRPVSAVLGAEGVQELRVRVDGGYDPAKLRVQKGRGVRIIFDRQERAGCSEEVVMPEFGIKRFLPAFQETVVEFTPTTAGSFEFTCGMGMLRGTIIVEEERGT
jgi:plastocyanin domain-containing protein